MEDLEQIIHDLRSKARQASRLPDTHKTKVHGEIDELLYDWQFATEINADINPLGTE